MRRYRNAAIGLAVGLAILGSAATVHATAACPTDLTAINSSQFPFPASASVVATGWFTMGRRSPALYTTTAYGVTGTYLGSNPGSPNSSVTQMSFRTKGPVGGGSNADCWPGPVAMAVADSPSGAGRMVTTWDAGVSICGDPEQLMVIGPPGGNLSYGQQVDVAGGVVSNATAAAAYTSGGGYAGYFTDSSAVYVMNATSPSGTAGSTPISASQSLAAWAGASRLAVLGNSANDQYLAAVFFTAGGGNVKLASIGGDGKLSPLAATANLSSGAAGSGTQQVMGYWNGSSYLLFVVVANGVDVFSFDGSTLTRLGTVANVGSAKYKRIQVPYGSPTAILLAERSSPLDIDVYTGGFLAGQSGAPLLSTTIPQASGEVSLGFGAYVDPAAPAILYTYRPAPTQLVIQSDTFDISCIAAPPSPNPSASFTLTDKSAQSRSDKSAYVGDTFGFTDTSKAGTGGAITNWYVWSNYNSSTSTKANADVSATAVPSLPNLVMPCLNGIVGGQCSYTPASITGTSLTEKFAELVSASSLDSGAAVNTLTIKVPQTRVSARGADGSVKILTGGSIDASGSDGSPTSFAWSYKDASNNVLSTSCTNAACVPPSSAATFFVAANYAGGYQAPAVTGSIVFTDIAGSISVPSSLYSSQSTTTASFALQKGNSVTITGVTYKYDNGAATAITPVPGLTSSASINVPALSVGASHTVTFTVTYTGGSLGSSVTFQDTFQYTSVQYAPRIWLSKQTSSTATDTCSSNVFGGGATTCSGSSGTFYLSDAGDTANPSFPATWNFGDGSPVDTAHTTKDFVSHSFAQGTYSVKLTVAGNTVSQSFTVGQTATLSATISGPTSLNVGATGAWSASVGGGTPPYTYNWSASDGGSGSGTSFSHAFAAAGAASVHLTVHDSAGHSASPVKSVTVGGGGCTGNCTYKIVISGPASVSLNVGGTWTASVSGIKSSDMSIGWTIASDPPGSFSQTKAGVQLGYNSFPAAGNYTLQANGSAIQGGGPLTLNSSDLFHVTVGQPVDPHIPSADFDVTGAQPSQFSSTWQAKAGDVIGLTAKETADSPVFSWDFGDSKQGSGRSVVHSFSQAGSYTVKLTVNNSYNHTNSNTTRFSITGQVFSAFIVPGAGHLVSSDPSGAYATELSLFNNSDAPVTVALLFETANAGNVDPTNLPFPTDGPGFITLQPNQGWTASDVTKEVLGGGETAEDGLGTIFMKYSGPAPSALARIYFSAGDGAPTYGTYLPVYPINASGASALAAGPGAPSVVQNVVGLKFNDEYKGGITVVSASPTGGTYDVNLYKDTGEQVGATVTQTIPGYQQLKLDGSSFLISAPDPDHIYYATVSPSAGSSPAPAIAIGTVTDNRTRDSLILTDDTPRPTVAAGETALYYLAGVGRFGAAKTDLYLLNTSTYPLSLNLRFNYADGTGRHTAQISELLPLGGHQALEIPDVISSVFPTVSVDVIGDLRIDYAVPPDQAPIAVAARNYTDTGEGTYGMQLPPYAASDGLLPGSSSRIVLTGLHNDFAQGSTTDYDYISRFGFVALGDGPVTVHAVAYDQADGANFWSADYTLNGAGYGHFLYIPTTGANSPAAFAGHAAFNMVVTVTGGDGTTPAAAFATVQDVRSRDLLFIPGKGPSY